jgi:hypothetical protein
MVDVLPEDTLAAMPYYTLHMCRGSKHYVRVYVLSDSSYD